MGTITSRNQTVKPGIVPISIIAGLFFIFGFITWINAILIPYFKIACQLNNLQSYLVAFAFYISYLIFAVPASYLLKKVGFKKGMMTGFWIMACGAFIFIPAAYTRTYELFLLGLFTLGAGLAILQTAANPYITILGPRESAARRFSMMGICNKIAGIIAPLMFAAFVLRPTDTQLFKELSGMDLADQTIILDELARRVILPYTIVGATLFLLGLFVRFSPLPEIDTDRETSEVAAHTSTKKNIIEFPHLILGAIAVFLHVGSQVLAVDTVIGYAHSMGIAILEAKAFPSYTLSATIIGYLLGISLIPKYISQLLALRICTFLGIVLTFLIIYVQGEVTLFGHHTHISIWFIVLLGFANSMIWAGIWPLAMDGLGRFIKIGASILIMGLSGNAILPLVYGFLADRFNVREAYWVLLPCYTYLCFYAIHGFKLKTWTKSETKSESKTGRKN